MTVSIKLMTVLESLIPEWLMKDHHLQLQQENCQEDNSLYS